MANAVEFHKCAESVGIVSDAFLAARQGLPAPTQYEADLAAYKLMEIVIRHVNVVCCVALIPKAGAHHISAWVVLRSAFEIALTANWLTIENDWKEREARWLGWIAGEEEYQKRLAGDLRPIAEEGSQKFEVYAKQLEARRLAITRLLPKDSREKRPSIFKMIEECRIEKKYYMAYRIGSQFTHGGPAVCEEVFETNEHFIRMKEPNYSTWADLFRMASWCIAQPGYTTLFRAGASEESVEHLLASHENLLVVASTLEK